LDGKALGFTFEICYAPSATILGYCKEKNRKSYQTFLGVGNPKTAASSLINLPNAELEVKQISALFKYAYTLVGSQATKENFLIYAPQSNVIHLACHGQFDKTFPLLSRLYLASTDSDRGYLTAAEIFNVQLQVCSLVTLSACQSGISNIIQGDELIGLSRGFLYAGTPTMLVTLWQIDDEATQIFMESFYRCLTQGVNKSSAMRIAQEYLAGVNESYAHPFFWGGFILIGDNL
jgi:CHAT domain-containing protein